MKKIIAILLLITVLTPSIFAIENPLIYDNEKYGFSMELYPEYKLIDSFTRTDRIAFGEKEESAYFKIYSIEEKGIYDSALISFKEIIEANKQEMKDYYGFGTKIMRNSEIEQISDSADSEKWEVYYYFRQEENIRQIDYYFLYPQGKQNLVISIAFVYPIKDREIKEKQIKEMLSTIKTSNK